MSESRHRRLYSGLLGLYPPAFRRRFAQEMVNVFEERLRNALSKSGFALVRLWARELMTLPVNLLEAHADEAVPMPLRLERASRLVLIPSAVLGVSAAATYLIADAGLFHPFSLVLLLAGIVAGGFVLGAGFRRDRPLVAPLLANAALLMFLAIVGSFVVDRALIRLGPADTVQSLTIPGVQLAALVTDSNVCAPRQWADKEDATRYRRIQSTSRVLAGANVVTMVRAGGVDGAYAGATLLVLLGAATYGHWFVRRPRTLWAEGCS